MCKVCSKIQKLLILANSLIWNFDFAFFCLTWDPIGLNNMGNHEVAGGGVSSERRCSSCSSSHRIVHISINMPRT